MSEGTKGQYQILSILKRIDEKVARLQAEAAKIPDDVVKLDAALSSRREEYQKAKDTFESHEKALRKAEADLKEKEDSLRKAEGKMMEVKTNEEYQAALKENQGQKTEKSGLEERVLTLMNGMEEHRRALNEAETKYKEFEAALSVDRKKLDQDRAKTVNALEEQLALRDVQTKSLSPEVSEIYQRTLVKVRGSVAIVVVENGMCLGCNMKIRPQLYNEVLGCKQIHRCPTCSRILITEPKAPEPGAV